MSDGFASLLTRPIFSGIRKRIARLLSTRDRQALACVVRNVLPFDDNDIVVRLTLRIACMFVDNIGPREYITYDLRLQSIDDHVWLSAHNYGECADYIHECLYQQFNFYGITHFTVTVASHRILTIAPLTTRALATSFVVDRYPVYASFGFVTYFREDYSESTRAVLNVTLRFRNRHEYETYDPEFWAPELLRTCIPTDRVIDGYEYIRVVDEANASPYVHFTAQ